MLQQHFTHGDAHFCIFIGPDWGEMGGLKVQIIFIGSPRCSPDSQDTLIWLVLFCNIVSLLWGQNFHNVSSLHAHANWMFDFIRKQRVFFSLLEVYGSSVHVLGFSWFYSIVSQCSSSSTPFVYILIFLICLNKKLSSSSSDSPMFTCVVFLCLFPGFCFPSLLSVTFSLHSYIHPPICSWCFLWTAPDPLNSAGSWLYNPNTAAWCRYVER